jgi:DNA repair exonuclease SbcCD ATPase subunit
MDTNHLEDQIAELEKQIQQDPTPAAEDDANAASATAAPADQDTTATTTTDDATADQPEDDDFTSDDEKKRARAFARQRQEAKALKERLEQAERERQTMAERLAKLEGRAEATPKPAEQPALEDQEPDADLYPEDHARWEVRQLKKELDEVKKFKQTQEQVSTFQREVAGVQALEGQFKTTAPDYDDAVQFLVEKEKRMKRLLNPQATDAQLESQIQAEKVALFKQILAAGKNPAEMVYEIAKQDGWQPKGKQAAAAPKPSLNKLADNQRRAASIIGGTPAESSGKVTSDQLFSMSMQELMKKPDTFWKEVEGKL